MDTEAYTSIKISVKKLFNLDLNHYKDEQMKRRLDSWLMRTQMLSWDDYFKVLDENHAERQKFRDYLTINVTEFFRDPERWKMLQTDVMPGLLKEAQNRAGAGLRVWSAGCSIGVEAYSLAILLDEIAPNANHYLLATDIDQGALKKAAARGPYSADEVRNLSQQQKQKYLTAAPPFYVQENLSRRLTFKSQDLLADRFESNFDLILCRNVIIYFTNEAKSLLYSKFHAALRPGGVLFLGGTEIIARPAEIGFRNYGISFYLKA